MVREILKDLKVAIFLAYKNIIFNKKSLFLVSTIIGLTYLSGVFIGGVINGLQVTIEDKAIETMFGNIIILPKNNEPYIYNVNEIVKKIRNLPGVIEVSPHFTFPISIVDKNGDKTVANLVIVDPERERATTIIDDSIIEGKYLSKGTTDGIVIGSVITKKYGIFKSIPLIDVSTGDKVTIVTPYGSTKVKILGIFKVDFVDAELNAYINKKQVERLIGKFLGNKDVATEIIIRTRTKGNEEKIVRILKNLGINAKIRTWKEQLGVLSQFTDSLMITNKIALIVSILVSFGVIYIMVYINVFQKRSQLGILKAIGIRSDVLIMSYVVQSLTYGVLGVILGFILTKVLVLFFTYHPIPMPLGDVIPVLQKNVMRYSALFILLSSLLAGYFSSKNIAHDEILDMIFKG